MNPSRARKQAVYRVFVGDRSLTVVARIPAPDFSLLLPTAVATVLLEKSFGYFCPTIGLKKYTVRADEGSGGNEL